VIAIFVCLNGPVFVSWHNVSIHAPSACLR
jgi:hypothetical protein